MRAVRPQLPLVAAAVLVTVTGCSSPTEQYCDTLAAEKETLTDLATGRSGGTDVLEATLDVFRALHDEAPPDIQDEWSTVVFAYEALADAFATADVTPAEYQAGSPPGGVTDEEARRIEGAAEELRSGRVMQAADGLEQHARDVCKVDLGLGAV